MKTVFKIGMGLAVAGLAACGGSDTEVEQSAPGMITLATSPASTSLITLTSAEQSDLEGVLDPSDPRSLDGDGQALTYVSAIDPDNGDRTKALLVSEQTLVSDLPSNSVVEYSGNARFDLSGGGGNYTGVMGANLTASFGTEGAVVDVEFSDVDTGQGYIVNGASTTDTTGAEYIAISNLAITDNSFAVGDDTAIEVQGFASSTSSIDFSDATIQANGVFAGPNAEEVAGAVAASTSNDFKLFTTFSGAQSN